MPLSLLSLFLASFCIGTTEFMIAGLLPAISTDLGVSIPTAGLLVSGYAIGVAVGGPIVGLALTPLQRKQGILAVMAIFILGHLWCALAANYGLLLAGRLVISLSHGSFFGMAVIVASSLVPPDRSGRAVALIVAGITVANILGVPGGTAIGQAFGWRSTFYVLGTLGLAATAAMAVLLPSQSTDRSRAPTFAAQFRALGNQEVYMTFLVIIAIMITFWSLFTFVAPLLINVSGLQADYVPALLLLFGVGATIGAFAGGRLADRWPRQLLAWIFPAQIAVFALVLVTSGNAPVMAVVLFILGIVTFAPNAAIVNRLLRGAAEAPELASTLMSTVFNIGIASGAYLGALALANGAGYQQLPLFGLAFGAVATALMLYSLNLEHRTAPSPVGR